ncbi:zinc finger protein 1035 [Xyrichtys novacula]|uniref:Zinc finger protein 1035 n=1 Tax=Xyrichtys novacula TaxID=13765 RepID=A0AAV1FMR8_XYRNO|nr:zinc finger protein 1035 [Xyrichtys novacula]
MAHGWDSYFHNPPDLTSDPSTFRRTSESETSTSEHLESLIGHHDFSSTVASHEATATNSNFNTNYYSNPSVGNSSSDCVYERFYKETQWQVDGQMEKKYLPNSEISDFATDALSAAVSFPSSFGTDIQGINQDCGALAASFFENYSDVSSCSDADVSETRPSCKFAASSLVPKPKIGVAAKHSSSEWTLPQPGNMNLLSESQCPDMSESTVSLQSPSNVKIGEHFVQSAHDKISNLNKTPECEMEDHPFTTSDIVRTTDRKNVEDGKNDADGPVQKQINETGTKQGESSNIQISVPEKLYQENEGFDKSNSMSGQAEGMMEDQLDESEMLKVGEKSDSLENKIFDDQSSSTPSSTNAQDENMENNCQETESDTNTFQSSDPPDSKVSDSKKGTGEVGECSSPSSNSHEHCSQIPEPQSCKSMAGDDDCKSFPVVKCDHSSHTSDKDETSIDSQSGISPQPCSPSTGVNSSQDNGQTSEADTTNTAPSVDPNQTGPGILCESPSIDTCDKSMSSVTDDMEASIQSNNSWTEMQPCLEEERTSATKDTYSTSCPTQHRSLCQTPEALEPESCSGNVAENSRESFQELDAPMENSSEPEMLYGEPLSREESSCDTDETKLDISQNGDSSQARPDDNTMDYSEGQEHHLISSTQIMKLLQPVVLMKTKESINGKMNSFHCANCPHTTPNVDHVIEHQHLCHLEHNFQFCEACNLYLMSDEEIKKHMNGKTNRTVKSSQPSSDSGSQKKKKKQSKHKCTKCSLRFSKRYQFIAHMRIHTGKTPFHCDACGFYFSQSGSLRRHKITEGRCKKPVETSKSDITEAKSSPQKTSVQSESSAGLPECFVKLVDILKTNQCNLYGKTFLTPKKAKEQLYDKPKRKTVAVSRLNSEKSQVGKETSIQFKCPLCPRVFMYSYNRAKHLRFCVKQTVFGGKGKVNGKFQCPLCYATFTLSSNRYRHLNSFCLKLFISKLGRMSSMSRQNFEQVKTQESVQIGRSKEEKKMQTKESEPKKQTPPPPTVRAQPRYKCNLCPAVFFDASGKYRHMKKHELYKHTGKVIRYRNSVFSIMSKPASLSPPKTEDSNNNLESTEAETNPSLSCRFCGKCFSTTQSLTKHQSYHKGDRPYSCLQCGKKFKRHAHLIGHKVTHQRRIQCTVCRKILPSIGELIQHRSSHLKRGMLKCPDCDMEFEYPAYLLKHLNTHKKAEEKSPQLKKKQSINTQQSSEPVKEDSGPKQQQCSLCRKVFADAGMLRKHCLTHISGSSNQCPFCKNHFGNRRYLLRHLVMHTGDKPLSCSYCGKQFYRDVYLNLHLKKCLVATYRCQETAKPDTKTRWTLKCSYCPRLFRDKARQLAHHSGHIANALVVCSKCKTYFGAKRLTLHQRVCDGTSGHSAGSSLIASPSKSTSQLSENIQGSSVQFTETKKPLYKCSYCTQSYRFRSLLLRHLVSHTGVQPYACSHCGKRFVSQIKCSQHESVCDDAHKKVECPDKSGAATQLSNMPSVEETAQKSQSGVESEFKCKFCTKTFMKPRNLRRHILTHNEVKPYRCRACDNCFSRYDHLKVHQVRCREKKQRLQVCIPKISLNDVGKGWQSKLGNDSAEKQAIFECTVCSRSFPTQMKLARHNTLYHFEKPFKCHKCGSAFSHAKTLKSHRKMRKCRKVLKAAASTSLPSGSNSSTRDSVKPQLELQNRVLQTIRPHFNKRNRHLCSYCPRDFKSIGQLIVHTRLHTGEKPHACEYCGMRFIRRDYVKRHYPKCSKKQTKVLCDGCGGFFPRAKLENHKKGCTSRPSSSEATASQTQQPTSKSPPKGFSCAYCSSRFLLFSQLQEHFLTAHKVETMVPPVSTAPLQYHLSNIPKIKENSEDERGGSAHVICKLGTALDMEVPDHYTCEECGLSFYHKNGLASHQRVHKTEHPYNCNRCKRGFWNKNLYRSHYRKCRMPRVSDSSTVLQLEAPLKVEPDFVMDESAVVLGGGTKSADIGLLQTNPSYQENSMDDPQVDSEVNRQQSTPSKEKKTVLYQCSECDQSFSDGLMLISHLEDHGRQEQEKKRNVCPYCGKVYSNQGNLNKHKKIHHADCQNYPCPDCTMTFDSQSELEIHRKSHEPSRPYSCKLCNQGFWTRPSLCSHYGEAHPDDVYHCRFCSKAYALKKSLSRHYKARHQNELKDNERQMQDKSSNEKQSSSQLSSAESDRDENHSSGDSDSDSAPYFPCHVCGKTFPTSESLEDHQRCHLGEKPHECEECGKCFYQASQLQQHLRMHKSEFQCQLCGRGFVSLFALRKHKHSHGKSRPYRCSKCYLSFTGLAQLAEHTLTHREESFPCDICDRVFPSKSSRVEHRKSHSRSGELQPPLISREENEQTVPFELKYRCGVCNERFRDPEELSEHGCIAAKERQYPCADCNKHFLHASHLKKHRIIHEISWSHSEYPCNYCNSSFSSSQEFLTHAKSHINSEGQSDDNTQEKDGDPSQGFLCPVCHQCFASAAELIFHFPVHPDGAFECKICKISFPSERKLKDHEHCHQTSSTEFQCTQCGQNFWGSDAFFQHKCSHQRHREKQTEGSEPSAKTPSLTKNPAGGDDEEVDVTGEDVYDCRRCSMQFSSKSSLLEHQNKQHKQEKPFKCELCGKRFALRRYLKEHERRHRLKFTVQNSNQLEENNLSCTQCHIMFNTTEELSLHMRMHAEKEGGEYRCDMCYKSFSQGSLLKQHQESHVGQIVYECTECDKAFAFPHLLEEHQQTHVGSSQ